MPIHDLGYRAWGGQLTAPWRRWWVIAQVNVQLAWRSRSLRRLLIVAWLPAAYMGIGFFMLEQGFANPNDFGDAVGFLGQFPLAEDVVDSARHSMAQGDDIAARHQIWSLLLLSFFRYPQGLLMALVIGLIAPPLIAQDVHSRAFLLYFSRPLTRIEYLVGKLSVVCGFVMSVTTLPALTLYVAGVLLSPIDAPVLQSTWDLPPRILAASVVVILPTATLALAFSSMTSRSLYAAFTWFAVWLLGVVCYLFIQTSLGFEASEHWSVLSLYHTLGKVQSWVFGLPVVTGNSPGFGDAMPSAVLLATITFVSFFVLYRRISSPMRV